MVAAFKGRPSLQREGAHAKYRRGMSSDDGSLPETERYNSMIIETREGLTLVQALASLCTGNGGRKMLEMPRPRPLPNVLGTAPENCGPPPDWTTEPTCGTCDQRSDSIASSTGPSM